jgi:enoyl-CoA hydratase/carnithine racemase
VISQPGSRLGSDDIGGELAEAYGYVNRSLPDAELDGFVDALANRIASFDKWVLCGRRATAAKMHRDRTRRRFSDST